MPDPNSSNLIIFKDKVKRWLHDRVFTQFDYSPKYQLPTSFAYDLDKYAGETRYPKDNSRKLDFTHEDVL